MTRARIALLAIVAGAGCTPTTVIPIHFDGPIAAAVLATADGPFEEPSGFVASSRNGTITPLNLKTGTLLVDDPTASFLRAAAIPTGRERILSDLVVVGDGSVVTLWAADNGSGELLQIPYILSVDESGAPVEREPYVTEPVFVDADGSGDAATMTAVKVRAGWTTTEDWSIEYDGTRWWAKGQRSGVQEAVPTPGELYHSDRGEIEFQIDGTATAGDRFDLTTDTGILAYTLDARVAALGARDGYVYASVASADAPAVHVYDGFTGAWLGAVWLAPGSAPGRMAFGPEGVVYVADNARPVVHALSLALTPSVTDAVDDEILTTSPVVDVAWQAGEGQDGTPYTHLFVAPLGGQRVDLYDTTTGLWVDPNPVSPEVEGIPLGAPVSGIAASLGEVWLQQPTVWGARQRVGTVAVSTGTGYVFQIDASTGCLVEDARGAHGPNQAYDNTTEWAVLDDQGGASDADIQIDPVTGEQIVASPCGGVTRSERWGVSFDSATQEWEVQGAVSGIQENRARMDERYLSDDGAISFVILSGPRAPTDGDRFSFGMDSGLLAFIGSDFDGDDLPDTTWEMPARPVAFETYNGATGGGWDEVDRRQLMLLPVTNSDLTARIWLDGGKADAVWR